MSKLKNLINSNIIKKDNLVDKYTEELQMTICGYMPTTVTLVIGHSNNGSIVSYATWNGYDKSTGKSTFSINTSSISPLIFKIEKAFNKYMLLKDNSNNRIKLKYDTDIEINLNINDEDEKAGIEEGLTVAGHLKIKDNIDLENIKACLIQLKNRSMFIIKEIFEVDIEEKVASQDTDVDISTLNDFFGEDDGIDFEPTEKLDKLVKEQW